MSADAPFAAQAWDIEPGRPLSPWTYTNPEFFELDYEAFFLRRWQFVGHVSDLPNVGDYLTHQIGRDNVFVIRGKDNALRAFQNVCRHRASRVLEGQGNCKGIIRCPYHGWSYQLDGSLLAIPQDQHFAMVDKMQHGLHAVQLEVFHGLIFVRVRGDGPGVAEHFGDMGRYFETYGFEHYVRCAATTAEVWQCNWKVAWDNYMENYHIPIGHPGLNRLLIVDDDTGASSSSGVDYGIFELKSKPSNVELERRYQEMAVHAQARVPASIRNKWIQFGFAGNLGIDCYPEMVDFFQLVPLSYKETLVRASYYGHPDPTEQERQLRDINIELNNLVNDEDLALCERVQLGLQTHGYTPGPLSGLEVGIHYFHEMVRGLLPVASETVAPPRGQVAIRNQELQLDRQ